MNYVDFFASRQLRMAAGTPLFRLRRWGWAAGLLLGLLLATLGAQAQLPFVCAAATNLAATNITATTATVTCTSPVSLGCSPTAFYSVTGVAGTVSVPYTTPLNLTGLPPNSRITVTITRHCYYSGSTPSGSGCVAAPSAAISFFTAPASPGPVPTLTGLSPTAGPVGTAVTLTGTNLTGTTALLLNGQAVTGYVVNAAGTSITFTVPANATAGPVNVTTAGGTAAAPGSFCVQYVPTGTGGSSCGPGSVVLRAAGGPVAGGTYGWYASATSTTLVGSSGNYLTPPLTASTTFYVAISTGSGSTACEGSRVPVVATIGGAPTVSVAAGGPLALCSGNSVVLTATGASTYLWNTGATTPSITVTQAGTYSVTGTSPTCTVTSATSAPVVVTQGTAPVASITASGPLTLCAGGSVALTASAGSTYLWSTGATTQAITVSQAGSYTVAVGNGNCSATSAATVVTMPSPVSVTSSGSLALCPGGSVVLTASAGSSYLWSTGATTQAITVSQAGSYTVSVGTGSCSASSTPVMVTMGLAPAASITASGPTTLCPGGSVVLVASPGSSYLWSTGDTTPFIAVTQAGSYSVTVGNGTCTATSAAVAVTSSPAPTASITASGSTALCQGESVTLTATGAAGTTYLWSTGASGPTLTVSQAGSYSVTATTASGCAATSAATVVSVSPVPAQPTVTQAGSGSSLVLSSSAASGNQWYLNGVAIAGAIGATYAPTGAGTYTVVVTSLQGCPSLASVGQAVVLATTPAAVLAQVQLYPNPTRGRFALELPATSQLVRVQVYNALGQTILSQVVPGKGAELNLTGQAAGVYAVWVQAGAETVVKRLVLDN